MTEMEKYVAAFTQVLGVDGSELNEDFTVKSSDKWDSMTHIQIVSILEDSFGIMLDGDEIIEFDSFEKGLEILRRYGITI